MKLIHRIFGRFKVYRRLVGGRWVKIPRRFVAGKFWYRVCRHCYEVGEDWEVTEELYPYPLDPK